MPSRLVLLVLLAGGFHAAVQPHGIDRAPRRVRGGICASASGGGQRLARGNRQGSGAASDAVIGPDTSRALSATTTGAGASMPLAALCGADPSVLPALADAGAPPDRPISRHLSVWTTASSRGPPAA